MRARALLAASVLAGAAIYGSHAPAAQLYKWVDERGVTNYSNQPPAQSVKRTGVVEDRVSVYTPDAGLARAIEAERSRALDDLRTGRRARDLQADWLARQQLAAAQAYNADPCANNSTDPRCTGYDRTPYYAPVGGFVPGRGARILPQIQLTPGTTAGNVTGSTGFIPGTSAFAPNANLRLAFPRPILEAPRQGNVHANVHGGGRGGRGR